MTSSMMLKRILRKKLIGSNGYRNKRLSSDTVSAPHTPIHYLTRANVSDSMSMRTGCSSAIVRSCIPPFPPPPNQKKTEMHKR
mmetsp:Transcript_27689/g.36789  ORF Transcript_27689/g.36789 Transcript_27689/m.36789 type:complete len:83 (+) Transcript_27689:101-349(+)